MVKSRKIILQKLIEALNKQSQQKYLPGINDLPEEDTLELPVSSDRYDLSLLDLTGFNSHHKADLHKIIIYELKNNPLVSKDEIVKLVLDKAKNNISELLKEYIQKIPELKANIPEKSTQESMFSVPDIRLFPKQEEIDEDKARIKKEIEEAELKKQEEIAKYDSDRQVIIDAYKSSHNGDEPSSWELNKLMGYVPDPRNKNNYNRDPDLDKITLDINSITQSEYTIYLNKLYNIYNEINTNYDELNNLNDKLEAISRNEEMPAPDPTQFTSYKDMINDLRERIVFGIQTVISNSVGYTLFNSPKGKYRRSYEASIFSDRDDKWFENPDKMKEFLEEIPRIYNIKSEFWSNYHYGSNPNEIKYWFEAKYNRMVNYNDSLKRARVSFSKGVGFFKTINSKLAANVDKMLNGAVFNSSNYIETTPIHREELNSLYLQIVAKINETSRVLGRLGYHTNNGLYNQDSYNDLEKIDIGAMLMSKAPQYKMIESLSQLLLSSIQKISKKINENEIGPIVGQLARELSKSYIKDKLNLEESDLSLTERGGYSMNDKIVVYGDPSSLKVADSWLKFASSNNLSKNFQSLIKYPEFIYKNDKEMANSIINSMKERLGFAVSKMLNEILPHTIHDIIDEIINSSGFVYAGPEELRKIIISKKNELYVGVQPELDKNYNFDLSFESRYLSVSNNHNSFQRFSSLKENLKIAIDNVKPNTNLYERLASENPGGYTTTKEKWNINGIINNLIFNSISFDDRMVSRKDMINRLLEGNVGSILDSLESNIQNRNDGPLGLATLLISQGYFIPKKIYNYISRGLTLDDVKKVEDLKQLKLETNFSGLVSEWESWVEMSDFPSYIKEYQKDNKLNDEELIKKFKLVVKNQEFLNKKFNELLEEAPIKLKYALGINDKITAEKNISKLFSSRLSIFGGVGPNAISNKFQEISKNEMFQHLPLQELAKLSNENTINSIKNKEFVQDQTSILYNHFSAEQNKGTTLAVALAIISKILNIKEPSQLLKISENIAEKLKRANISREDVEYIFPALITNIDALSSQLESAIDLAKFAHNEGSDLSKETILSIAKNPNFKDWIKEVDAIKHFYSAYIKIKRLGSPRKYIDQERIAVDSLLKTKSIKRGIQRRLELIVQTFESNVRINPSIEGFDSIKSLIIQTKFDLDAIEKYAAFKEYNTKISEEKLFKDPQLAKLNWNMPGKKFRFRVLDTFDPYHFRVGVDTNCCQKLGGVGEDAAIDSYINPIAGVVLLELNVDGIYKTAAQSYFHYVPTDNGIILDNVEVSELSSSIKKITEYDLDEIYAIWANVKKNELDYKYFLCGSGYNKLSNEKFKTKSMRSDPRSFKHDEKYTDWKSSSSVDLLEPKFNLPEVPSLKKKREKRVKALFDFELLLNKIAMDI